MHKEYILLNGFRKAKKDFTAGFHVPLNQLSPLVFFLVNNQSASLRTVRAFLNQ